MATLLLLIASLYFSVGLLVAALLILSGPRGLPRLDSAAHGASLSVRLLLVPGLSTLWPLLAFRWFRAPSAKDRP